MRWALRSGANIQNKLDRNHLHVEPQLILLRMNIREEYTHPLLADYPPLTRKRHCTPRRQQQFGIDNFAFIQLFFGTQASPRMTPSARPPMESDNNNNSPRFRHHPPVVYFTYFEHESRPRFHARYLCGDATSGLHRTLFFQFNVLMINIKGCLATDSFA